MPGIDITIIDMEQLLLSGWPAPLDESTAEENDFDALLQLAIQQAKAVGIPVSKNISPNVLVNTRATTRFGCCKKMGDIYIIEMSSRLLRAPSFSCQQILAHEVLHTCHGCYKHGPRWRSYARRMGSAYGYTIARVDSFENLGITDRPRPKYIVTCKKCGRCYERMRASKLTQHPERYTCRCGGKLRCSRNETN